MNRLINAVLLLILSSTAFSHEITIHEADSLLILLGKENGYRPNKLIIKIGGISHFQTQGE